MLTMDELSGPESCSHPEIRRRARESIRGRFGATSAALLNNYALGDSCHWSTGIRQ